MNSPCSTTPGIFGKRLGQTLRIGDRAKRTVENVVAAVGHERLGFAPQSDRTREFKSGDCAFNVTARGREAERNDLDRQWKSAEAAHEFRRVGDHRHPPGGRRDDLFS